MSEDIKSKIKKIVADHLDPSLFKNLLTAFTFYKLDCITNC